MNLSENLSATAARIPERPAIAYAGTEITYAQLEAEATRFAVALGRLGLGPGDRVALWLPNHPAFASAMYGTWRAGGVVVPVHSLLTEPEARHILEDSGARLLVCGLEQQAKVPSGPEHMVVVDGRGEGALGWDGFLAEAEGNVELSQGDDDDLALIAYTSGTSGLPKGAMLTHANLAANLDQMRSVPVAVRSGDVALCILPLFHIFGLNVVLNLAVREGAEVVLMERFDPSESLETIRRHRVSVVAAAPPAYVAWLGLPSAGREDFESVRVAVSGAAPLPREVLQAFSDRFGVTIWEGYGLTETAPALTSTSVGGVPKAGSVGRPLDGVEVRLVNEFGQDVEPGDPGEVVVRGPNVFRGYWNHPEDTERAFTDGWFRTGDVAVADDDGDLYIVDRRRDLILVSGFNVYPKEVEDVLRGHPGVADCAVVGAPHPYHGEQVCAFVVAAPGEQVTVEAVLAHCQDHLAPYKVPSRIEIVDEIPRNAAGKVLRRVLRD